MAWVNISEADLKTRLSGPELAAFRSAALASGQADPIADLIEQNVNKVRGYIAACQRNTLGADGTIPDKLLGTALSLIVLEVMARAAGIVIDSNDVRRMAAKDATRLLENVARCQFAIEQPTTESSETIQNFEPTFSGRDFRFKEQDGI